MPNRLAQTQSLYLRKHADNPINWWYWGDEALNAARAEDKPIFLSIGYSSCHWCTVMEGEAFSDGAIAEYLNANFIAIKVDREERADLDSIYMQALQMMTGQGGWPLNIFLDARDLIPFYGGTYFPVEPRYGRPGFLQVLQSINDFYHRQKDKLEAFKQEMLRGLTSTLVLPASNDDLTARLLSRGIESNTKVLARNEYGTPRFPMIPYSNIALQGCLFSPEKSGSASENWALARQRGKDLANGGIYDGVGGGFHRYTVDATWTVPHFEKMLYDNGLIMEYLANLWSLGITEPEFKTACEGTLNWLKREMTAPAGYFYAAQDADSLTSKEDEEPEEGAFYVWHYRELENHLAPEELDSLKEYFYIAEEGNFEGKIVLQRRAGKSELSGSVRRALGKLFALRYGEEEANLPQFPPAKNNQEAKNREWKGRIPPVTDTKMIVAWNSLMISGLARAYGVFGDGGYLTLAARAANFILENQWQDGRLYRLNYDGKIQVLAQAEDYAFLIKALLDLYNNSGQDSFWLEKARAIQEEFNQYFSSLEMGGFYNNATDNSDDLPIKERSYIDNATPSPNGVAIANLIRLSLVTENLEYWERAERGLKSLASAMEKSPVACPSLFVALDWYLFGRLVRSNPAQIKELNSRYLPTTIYQIMPDLPEKYVGIVCQGFSCLEPAANQEQLLRQIRSRDR